jgi:hypothetical protein
MGRHQNRYSPVAYMFQADLYTPAGLVNRLVELGIRSPGAWSMSAEDVLDQWANDEGVERNDEYSFNSDDFPKVILPFDTIPDGEYINENGERVTL